MKTLDISKIRTDVKMAYEKIHMVDFSLQKRKMCETLGWESKAVELMEEKYKKFLALSCALDGEEGNMTIVPNRMIDEFWHMHIMDTQKYQQDCEIIFGKYFHHFPYYGMRDEADQKDWEKTSLQCEQLWQEVYDEPLYDGSSEDNESDAYQLDRELHKLMSESFLGSQQSPVRCRTTCKPMKCR